MLRAIASTVNPFLGFNSNILNNRIPKMATNGYTNGTGTGTVNGHKINDLPPLYTHCIDDYRPMKVIVIGAGLSGILAGIRFPQYIQNLDLTIYDKNSDVGGTWHENK